MPLIKPSPHPRNRRYAQCAHSLLTDNSFAVDATTPCFEKRRMQRLTSLRDTKMLHIYSTGSSLTRVHESLCSDAATPRFWKMCAMPSNPPHDCVVSNKTELIAKRVRKGSNELSILEYLQTKQPRSPHVIKFIEAIPSTTREWLILPKLRSICDQVLLNSREVSGRVQLGWGLIKGLAYLHEHNVAHRDVKPDNLVCNEYFRLQIIDFDIAIQVQDENTEIGEYRGTEGWTAPQMGTGDGPTPMHSPIKADRWSCGRVLLYITPKIMTQKEHKRLLSFIVSLIANDPQRRPSLLEWSNLASPCSDGQRRRSQRLRERGVTRKDMAEVDGKSMKPPNAKKPRLKR